MFNPSNFIYAYLPSDKVIRIIDNTGKIIQTINICNYQKCGINGSILSIYLEDNDKSFDIKFNTSTDASTAILYFLQAVNTLKSNCEIGSIITGGTNTSISITLLNYKSLVNTNSVIPLQFYDITDTTSLLYPSVLAFRIITNSVSDNRPKGIIISTGVYVTLDLINNKISSWEDPIKNNSVINGNFSGNSFDSTSTNCIAFNNSKIIAINSTGIFADNGSVINVTNSNVVKVTNSNVTISGASNTIIDNIQQDLSSLPFTLSNVSIDRNISMGKNGYLQTSLDDTSNPINLYSYGDVMDQEFNFSVAANVNINLDNLIHAAQGIFKIKMTGVSGSSLTICSSDNVTLFVILEYNKDFIFQFSRSTNKFEFFGTMRKNVTDSQTVQFLTPTNGQTDFSINIPVTQVTETEMFINGHKQIYGVDFHYDSNFGLMRYNNLPSIGTDDTVEFRIY